MINPRTGRRHVVRTDLVHERRSALNQNLMRPNQEWKVYSNRDVMNYVLRFSTWDTRRDEFVYKCVVGELETFYISVIFNLIGSHFLPLLRIEKRAHG